jgi:multimeric flavodoxin WrbA
MKVLAINGTYRENSTTTELTARALKGAAEHGAETKMILLKDHDIKRCRNCLTCYRDLKADIGPCPIEDDTTAILEKIRDADGVMLSSPVHIGSITGLMFLFYERMLWRVCKPTGELLGMKGMPEPRTDKVRALASIVSAGATPNRLRKTCDPTSFLKQTTQALNGQWVGDMYAGAFLTRLPDCDEDWERLYFLRKLTKAQLQEAYDLGAGMAQVILKGNMRPTPLMGAIGAALARVAMRSMAVYTTADSDD